MGNKVSVDEAISDNVSICYYPPNLEINWAYFEPVKLFNLDSFVNVKQPIRLIHYSDKILNSIEDSNSFEAYFIYSENQYPKRKLYSIQDNYKILKTFDNIDVSDEENISDVELIDLNSRESKLNHIFILKIERFSEEFDNIFSLTNDLTFRQKLSKYMNVNIPSKYSKVLLYKVIKQGTVIVPDLHEDKNQKLPDDINKNLGITIKDIDPKEYPFYFLHSSKHFDKILKSGKICPYGKCDDKIFDEETGKYLYPKRLVSEYESISAPGVYMEYLELNDFYMPPTDHSAVFRAKILHTAANIFGQIGFIFPLEEVFKYHVNVKRQDSWGKDEDVDLRTYYAIGVGTEIVVRANSIDISTAIAIHVMFKAIEIKFIYDYIPKRLEIYPSQITLQNVIDTYEEQRNNHWYIRKSNLLKVVDGYKALGLDVPPLLCSRINYDHSDKIYDTIYDTDSEPEEELLK